MKTFHLLHILVILCFSASVHAQPADSTKGLKDYYKDYFLMGVAVSPQALKGPEAALILKHFGSMTCENVMKMGPIHPKETEYNWGPADEVVNFAQANGLKMRGHTLCWHNQTPPWLFKDAAGNEVSKEVLLNRLKEHITAVVSRYKGKVYAWDVVNEAIDDDRIAAGVCPVPNGVIDRHVDVSDPGSYGERGRSKDRHNVQVLGTILNKQHAAG